MRKHERPPEEYGVDRVEMEVRQRMELTITNRPIACPAERSLGKRVRVETPMVRCSVFDVRNALRKELFRRYTAVCRPKASTALRAVPPKGVAQTVRNSVPSQGIHHRLALLVGGPPGRESLRRYRVVCRPKASTALRAVPLGTNPR